MEYKRYIILEKNNFLNSDGLCNLNLTKNYINLDNVRIETSLKKTVDALPKRFNFKLFYKDMEMKKVKLLGEGTFGKIFLYKCDDKFLAIKINREGVPMMDEVLSINKYLPKVCKYSIIPLKVVKDSRQNPFVIMQVADADLKELEMSEPLKIKVLITVAKALKCFLKKGIVYMDLKLENILYKCANNKIAIYFGDVGSLVEDGETLGNGEIVVPESRKDEFVANEAYLLYTFGAFILEMYGYKLKDRQKFYKNTDINPYLQSLVYFYTTENPKKRLRYNLDLVDSLVKNKK